jgi:3-oxoacyl-[acyl-carrier-protein] synthase III
MESKILSTYSKRTSQQTSLLELLQEVAIECISSANITFDQVDLLLNTSVYNENYMSEPALAALLQKKLCNGIFEKKQFSMDINRGACGVIHALQMADVMIKDKNAMLVLIVSGDTQPLVGDYSEIQITNSAGAILLGKANDDKYFKAFHFENYPEHFSERQSYISWENPAVKMNHKTSKEYDNLCIQKSQIAIQNYLQTTNELNQPILLSNLPFESTKEQTSSMDLDYLVESTPYSYTTSIISTLYENKEILKSNRDIILHTCSSGISISLAHYKSTSQ